MAKMYKPPTNRYTIEGPVIRVEPGSEVHKVSGTSMAGILGRSPWSSPFQVACNLLGLAREDIGDKPVVKVGNALESIIIDYADKAYADVGSFFAAEKIFEKRTGDHDSWVSDFEDSTFAGHVDGIVMNDDGDFILEVKTSGNMESWSEGVPDYYRLQVALYDHFVTKKGKAYVLLGAVNEFTYADWHSWIPNENTVALFPLEIDQEQFAEELAYIEQWYAEYILQGVTPPYDPANPGDVEMYEHLVNLAKDVSEIQELVQRYRNVTYAIDNLESQNKDKYDAREALKAQIKDYMEAHQLAALGASDGYGEVVLSKQTRKGLDEKAMERDGIDLSKYRTIKTINTFRLKE